VDAPSVDVAQALGLPARGPDEARLVMGRREWLALPDLGVFPVHAKTDTGARGSSLHAENIWISPDQSRVRFTTVNHQGEAVECEAAVVRFGRVRSSNGISRKRVFIRTTAVLCGGFRWSILVSLANRADMLCPLLLGRRDLAGYFLIDPQGHHLLGTRRELVSGLP
jgi:ribosomal protein S6--L-glutamate ligase